MKFPFTKLAKSAKLTRDEIRIKDEVKALGSHATNEGFNVAARLQSVIESAYESKATQGSRASYERIAFTPPRGVGYALGTLLGVFVLIFFANIYFVGSDRVLVSVVDEQSESEVVSPTPALTLPTASLESGETSLMVEQVMPTKSVREIEEEEVIEKEERAVDKTGLFEAFGTPKSIAPPIVELDSVVREHAVVEERVVEKRAEQGGEDQDPGRIAERGELLEQTVSFTLMSSRDDSIEELRSYFSELGGFVEEVSDTTGHTRLHGKIPVENLKTLRMLLQEFAKQDKYYGEDLHGISRTPEVIVIEDEIKGLEERIRFLEGARAHENDEDRIAEIDKELKEKNVALGQAQEREEVLFERIEYVSVSISLTKLKHWWQVRNSQELYRVFAGIAGISFVDRIVFNIINVFGFIVFVFSYTFWLIIPLLWLGVKRYKQKAQMRAME